MVDADEHEIDDCGSWRRKPVNYRELIRRPDGENDEKYKAREIDRAASAQTRVATNVDHTDISHPHGE